MRHCCSAFISLGSSWRVFGTGFREALVYLRCLRLETTESSIFETVLFFQHSYQPVLMMSSQRCRIMTIGAPPLTRLDISWACPNHSMLLGGLP